MYRNQRISLVIPAYNEERLIRPTLENVPELFDRVYVVDDCSPDSTPEVVKEMAEKDNRIILLRHAVNQGVGQGIITGYLKSAEEGYDIAVVCGGDFQMPLDQTDRLLNAILDEGADYAKGNRFMNKGNAFDIMPNTRFIGNTLLSLMTKIASGNYEVFDVVDGFTAITREAIEAIDWSKAWKGYGYPMDFVIRISGYGLKIVDVPRTAIYIEGERQSQIKGFRYMLKVTPMIFRAFLHRLSYKFIFTDFHPLVLHYFAGLILFPLGLLIGLYLIFDKLFLGGEGVTASWSVLCALFIISGLQFLSSAIAMDIQKHDTDKQKREADKNLS